METTTVVAGQEWVLEDGFYYRGRWNLVPADQVPVPVLASFRAEREEREARLVAESFARAEANRAREAALREEREARREAELQESRRRMVDADHAVAKEFDDLVNGCARAAREAQTFEEFVLAAWVPRPERTDRWWAWVDGAGRVHLGNSAGFLPVVRAWGREYHTLSKVLMTWAPEARLHDGWSGVGEGDGDPHLPTVPVDTVVGSVEEVR